MNLFQLAQHIFQVKFAFHHFAGHFFGFFPVDGFHGLFDQRNDIALPRNAAGETVGMKLLKLINLFTGSEKLNRHAGNHFHRQRGTGTGRTVNTGQNKAAYADLLLKLLGYVTGILTNHCIGNQQDFRRFGNLFDFYDFVHKLAVNVQASG